MTLIKCPYCENGKAELKASLEVVFDRVPRRGATTAKQIADFLDLPHVTICHRLYDLMVLGLLTRDESMKEHRYSRPPAPRKRKP